MSEQNLNEFDPIVTMTDDEGNDTQFEFLDIVEYNGNEYAVLLPLDEEEEGTVVIFRIEGDEDDETYIGVDNEEEAEAVFQLFKEQNADEYDFE